MYIGKDFLFTYLFLLRMSGDVLANSQSEPGKDVIQN